MNEEPGLTLQEALEEYTDRDKWRAYQEAYQQLDRQRYRSGSLAITVRGGDAPTAHGALKCAYRRAEKAVVADLWQRLMSGELIATGFEWPLRLDSRRDPIPGQLFRGLRPNFRDSSVEGGGFKAVDVRVQRREPAEPVAAQAGGAAVDTGGRTNIAAADPIVTIPPRKRGGKPGLPKDFEIQMRLRADASQMEDSLYREGEYLEDWWKAKHPDEHPWKASSIRNNLRRTYKELRTRKRGPK